MRNIIFLIFCTLILLCSCSNNMHDRIYFINELIENQQYDSAQVELSRINYSRINNKNDIAYYNLMRVKLSVITETPFELDTLINYSINQFKNEGNDSLLAECYFYKGTKLYDEKKTKEAVDYLKKAENLSKNNPNLNIRHKIVEKLAVINLEQGEINLGLKYCDENLNISSLANNSNWVAYAYMLYFGAYKNLGNMDKAMSYLKKTEPYVKHIDKEGQSHYYSLIAFYLVKSNPNLALEYINKAKKCETNQSVYNSLSLFYEMKGDKDKAIAYQDSAYYLSTNNEDKSTYLANKSYYYYKYGEYKNAYETLFRVMELKDTISKERQINNISNIEAQNEMEMRELKFHQWIYYSILTVVILLLIIAATFLYLKFKSSKVKAKILENQLLIDIYSKKVSELKDFYSNKKSEVNELQGKIDDLNNKQSDILYEGKKLYESVMAGETVVLWDKKDFVNFLEYYKIKDLPFVIYLNTEYEHLTPRYKFFEILYHLGKNDEEVERILGISHSTVKSTKSRIRSKKIE